MYFYNAIKPREFSIKNPKNPRFISDVCKSWWKEVGWGQRSADNDKSAKHRRLIYLFIKLNIFFQRKSQNNTSLDEGWNCFGNLQYWWWLTDTCSSSCREPTSCQINSSCREPTSFHVNSSCREPTSCQVNRSCRDLQAFRKIEAAENLPAVR